MVFVHRIVMELDGRIKDIRDTSIESLRTCDTPACFEPTHLIAGTHKQNIRDAVKKGRHRTGWIKDGVAVASKTY